MGDDASREQKTATASRVRWRDLAFRGGRAGRRRLISELMALALRFAWVAVLGAAFFVLGDTVVEDKRQRLDNAISRFAHSHLHPHLTRLMLWGSDIASASVVVPLMLAVCGLLLFRKRRVEAALIATSWIGGQALHAGLKLVYQRPRPSLFPPLVPVSGYSFPSGHTVTAVMTYGLLALLLGQSRPRSVRLGWAFGAALIVVWVAMSRVYLGAHYATDVLGSILIAGAWLRFSVTAIRHLVPDRASEIPRPDA
jgi:undecaprenyl-diphosphatase